MPPCLRHSLFRAAEIPLLEVVMEEIQNIAVIGSGTMGSGIAQVSAMAGFQVVLSDITEAALAQGDSIIRSSLNRLRSKERITQEEYDVALKRIRATTDLDECVCDADLVIEAIPEKLELKLQLFEKISAAAKESAIFATNTSSLSVTEIAAHSDRPARCIGLHFFNPVAVMKLVEIVRGLKTDSKTVDVALAYARAIKKEPVTVNDWPGFATSRLGIILGCEAIRMVEQGVASAENIDKAMELGYRHPMGPLRLTDLVGLDVRLHIMEYLHRELGEQFRPPALLRQMVRAGKLGRKTGEGFYSYE